MLHEIVSGWVKDDGMDRFKNLRRVYMPLPPIFQYEHEALQRDAEIDAMIARGEIPGWAEVISTPFGPKIQVAQKYCQYMQMYTEGTIPQ